MDYQITYKITSAFITNIEASGKEDAIKEFRTWESHEIIDDISEGDIQHDEIAIIEVIKSMTQRTHRGIVCPYCHKFLDFSFGFEEATGVVCLYCRANVPVSNELMVGLVEVGE